LFDAPEERTGVIIDKSSVFIAETPILVCKAIISLTFGILI